MADGQESAGAKRLAEVVRLRAEVERLRAELADIAEVASRNDITQMDIVRMAANALEPRGDTDG